jgi:Putative DNA-binding domain
MNGDTDMPSLEVIQRWFQTVISHPEGLAAGELSASTLPGCEGLSRADVVVSTNEFDADARLGVYANAYLGRLIECMENVFPVLARTLGGEVFHDFAADYLAEHPSTSYTLHHLGRNFPDHLVTLRPERLSSGEPDWADFIIDLARFEWAVYDVFDGPGCEDVAALSMDRLKSVDPVEAGALRLTPSPALRLLKFAFPVNAFYSEVRAGAGEPPEAPDPCETFVALSRIDYIVRRAPLDVRQFKLLEALVAGRTVAEAIEAAFGDASDAEMEVLSGQIPVWFATWGRERFFVEISGPSR